MLAAEAGADAVGVNFWSGSKRFVGDERAARSVFDAVPPGLLKIGVFVNAAPAEVVATAQRFGLDRIQLHGDERPEVFAGVLERARLVRAVRVRDAGSFTDEARWSAAVFLYDAFVDGYGGGGTIGPWSLIAARAQAALLAGGRTAARQRGGRHPRQPPRRRRRRQRCRERPRAEGSRAGPRLRRRRPRRSGRARSRLKGPPRDVIPKTAGPRPTRRI